MTHTCPPRAKRPAGAYTGRPVDPKYKPGTYRQRGTGYHFHLFADRALAIYTPGGWHWIDGPALRNVTRCGG